MCIPPPPDAGRQEKLRIEVASSERWQRRTCVRVLAVRAASEVECKPALELSRTPPPNEAMGRITVDAREKEGLRYDAPRTASVANGGTRLRGGDMSPLCVGWPQARAAAHTSFINRPRAGREVLVNVEKIKGGGRNRTDE